MPSHGPIQSRDVSHQITRADRKLMHLNVPLYHDLTKRVRLFLFDMVD